MILKKKMELLKKREHKNNAHKLRHKCFRQFA